MKTLEIKSKLIRSTGERKKEWIVEKQMFQYPNSGDYLLRVLTKSLSQGIFQRALYPRKKVHHPNPLKGTRNFGLFQKVKCLCKKTWVEPAESDLLVTCLQKSSNSLSKHKSKISDKGHTDEANKVGGINDYDVKVIVFTSLSCFESDAHLVFC